MRAWIDQAKRYSLDSELIVAVREPLSSAPTWARDSAPCELRFIDLSGRNQNVGRTPSSAPDPLVRLFGSQQEADGASAAGQGARPTKSSQALKTCGSMTAKNAAIRRSRGEFLLSTSIDTLFSGEMVGFLASRRLERGRLYRIEQPGDFILMAREHWMDVRGYPELNRFSRDLENLLCSAVCHIGVREEMLWEPMRLCQRERGVEPERGEPIPNEEAAWLVSQMESLHAPLIFNTDDWGLARFALPETVLAMTACGVGMGR